MYLSYRGVAQTPRSSIARRYPVARLRRRRQLAWQIIETSVQSMVLGTRSVLKVAALHTHPNMATFLKSSTTVRVLEDSTMDSKYHSLERSLQLAYAVGDRRRIASLESEIEQLTGWRFSRR